MKSLLIPVISFLSFTITNGQKLIAVQNGGISNFYKTADEAFDNAVENDTLYFPSGVFSLNRSINKTLHIVGVGHNPKSTLATGITAFATITENVPQLIYVNGGGGSIIGIAFNQAGNSSLGNIRIDNDIDNLLIDRVNLRNGLYGYNGVIRNLLLVRSVVYKFDIRKIDSDGVLPSGLISNNVIYDNLNGATNLTIANNNFLTSNGNGNPADPPVITDSCNVINNIFNRYSITSIFHIAKNSSFRNNSGFGNGSILVSGTNYLSNNVNHNVWFDKIFISSTAFPSYGSFYNSDFHLTEGSSMLTGANDGGQIGIYGGRFPWKDGSIPFNPHIVSKEISGATDENGNLNIKFQVQAQKN